jgi:hypothetical protein
MSVVIDQTKLRRLCQAILLDERLDRRQAAMVLSIAQLAAGADHAEHSAEVALLHALAQWVSRETGIQPERASAIPPLPDRVARLSWLRAIGRELHSPAARDLAFAFAFLVFVADLELVSRERTCSEELQRAFSIDDRRATDIVVLVTDIVTDAADQS